MFGKAGLLYIMFLAGLELDMAGFKRNTYKSIVFGLFTFFIPLSLGIFLCHYVLHFNLTAIAAGLQYVFNAYTGCISTGQPDGYYKE